jgi:hypothetical protein
MLTDWQIKVYGKRDIEKLPENWEKIREKAFKRYNYTCYRCEKRYRKGYGLTAHHLIPRVNGGTSDQFNLVVLCNKCHDFVEVNDLRSLAAIVGSIETPILVVKVPEPLDEKLDWHAWVYGGARNPYLDGPNPSTDNQEAVTDHNISKLSDW